MRTIVAALFLISLSSAHSEIAQKEVPPISDKAQGADKTKDNPTNQQTVTVGLPPAINVTVGGKLEMKTEQENTKGYQEASKLPEWLMALFTGCLVVVTGYLVYYTKKLWASTSTLVEDAKDTAKRQLRAYVLTQRFHIEEFIVGKPIRVTCAIVNRGQTPAREMVTHGWTAVHPYPIAEDQAFKVSDEEITSAAVCAPGDDDKGGVSISKTNLTTADVDNIQSGTHHLYVYALITYKDIFHETHTTETLASVGGAEFISAANSVVAAAVSTGKMAAIHIKWTYSKKHNRFD
jgi:hypothetical protein